MYIIISHRNRVGGNQIMKKMITLLVAALAVFSCGISYAADEKPLIIFFSYGGNSKSLAQEAQKLTGGELFEITAAKPYPKSYQATVDLAKKELQENARPALKQAAAPGLAGRSMVIIAAPNWWGSIPTPVMTFLEKNDLGGKNVLQIITHGGGGAQHCADDLRKLAPKAKFSAPLVVSGNDGSGMRQWLASAGALKK